MYVVTWHITWYRDITCLLWTKFVAPVHQDDVNFWDNDTDLAQYVHELFLFTNVKNTVVHIPSNVYTTSILKKSSTWPESPSRCHLPCSVQIVLEVVHFSSEFATRWLVWRQRPSSGYLPPPESTACVIRHGIFHKHTTVASWVLHVNYCWQYRSCCSHRCPQGAKRCHTQHTGIAASPTVMWNNGICRENKTVSDQLHKVNQKRRKLSFTEKCKKCSKKSLYYPSSIFSSSGRYFKWSNVIFFTFTSHDIRLPHTLTSYNGTHI